MGAPQVCSIQHWAGESEAGCLHGQESQDGAPPGRLLGEAGHGGGEEQSEKVVLPHLHTHDNQLHDFEEGEKNDTPPALAHSEEEDQAGDVRYDGVTCPREGGLQQQGGELLLQEVQQQGKALAFLCHDYLHRVLLPPLNLSYTKSLHSKKHSSSKLPSLKTCLHFRMLIAHSSQLSLTFLRLLEVTGQGA